MRLFLLGLVIITSFGAFAETLITQSVAEVNSEYLTSRQIILTSLLSECIKTRCNKLSSVSTKVRSEAFINQLSKTIFERLAYYESVGVFDKYSPISKQQLNRVMLSPISKKLQFTKKEVLKAYRIKMLARKYIEFKDKNLSVYITNAEAKKFYTKNKSSYSVGKFSSHLVSIKKSLQNKRKGKRVEDWITNMQLKYKVKQFIN